MIGPLELRREFHHAHRLAVALRLRHAEVADQLLLRVAALLLADHHHRLAFEEGHARNDGGIVGKGAIAVQFHEVGEQPLDVIERSAGASDGAPVAPVPTPDSRAPALRPLRIVVPSSGYVAKIFNRLGAADALDFGAKFLVRPDPSGHIQNNREVLRPFEPQADGRVAWLAARTTCPALRLCRYRCSRAAP